MQEPGINRDNSLNTYYERVNIINKGSNNRLIGDNTYYEGPISKATLYRRALTHEEITNKQRKNKRK